MKLFWAILALILTCLVLGGYFWYHRSLQPISTQETSRAFVVEAGDPAALVIQKLVDKQFIKSYYPARLYFRLNKIVFRPGVHYISPHQSVSDIFITLGKDPKDIKITFPEGWRREQFAARLRNIFPDFNTGEFLELTATLEGRLFPDTYYFSSSPTAQKVVTTLTNTFQEKTGLDLNNSQVVILASLVERESNNAKDSKMIAGIILKRLENFWPLQLDATVQYAKDTENCLKKVLTCDYWQPIYDTKFPSPYNTYLNSGLPPSPIASPGLATIQAAQNPISSDYWYYLTGNDGITYFAKDLATHQKHIDTYLKP